MHLLPCSPLSLRRLLRGVSLLTALLALTASLSAQNDAAADNGGRQRRRQQNGDNADNGNGNGRGRGNFDPQQMQEQMLSRLREQFDVSDDAEWKLISDRLLAVAEARRATGGGLGGAMMMFGRGGQGGQQGGRAGRFGGGSPEADALRSAIQDKLPDAEIKSRLERLRESRKANEEKLAKAQEDLRAVLSVRQEAVAVMAGLLP
jgi:hypothetical protein